MKNFFVIGSRTSKSLSPLIFNHWFKKYKIVANYSYIEVNKTNFEKVLLNKIFDNKTAGFNVTTPYKTDVIKHIDKKDKHAKKIGAINCVTNGKKTKGTNTDWLGYLNSIKGLKINKNNKIIILGYGGASKAIVYGLLSKGFKNVLVFNRSKKAISFGSSTTYTKKYTLVDNHLAKANLIINTTPTNPLNKKQIKLIKKNTVISDIVYRPRNTRFLENFKENKKIYGIKMLVEQAIPCFRLWFGFVPKIDTSLLRKLNKKIKCH